MAGKTSASYDGTARIWSVASGELLHTLKGHSGRVQAVAFSPDGKWIATAGNDKRMILWNADTGRLIPPAYGLHLTMVNTYYTSAQDGTVRRWLQATNTQWIWALGGNPDTVAIHPAGDQVAVGIGDGGLRLYPLPDAQPPTDLQLPQSIWQLDAHKHRVMRIAFNADATLMATASHDRTVKLWRLSPDNARPELINTWDKHTNTVHDVAFSPDGRTLASASYDGHIGLLDVASGKGELFKAHGGRIASVSFSADGRQLLSAGIRDFALRLWDISTQPHGLVRELPHVQDRLM